MDNFGEIRRLKDRGGNFTDCWSVGSVVIPVDNGNVIVQLRYDETHGNPHTNIDQKLELVCGSVALRGKTFALPEHYIKL